MAEDINLGRLVGTIAFELPDSEAAKLDLSKYQSRLGQYSTQLPGAAGSQASTGDAMTPGSDENKKLGKDLFKGAEETPIGKGMKGITAMLGPIGAVLTVLAASGGLRQLLGAFFDLLGLISDLIFISIYPVLKPLLEGFVQIAKVLIEKSQGVGGIFAALLDPTFFISIALLLITALTSVVAELVNLFADILIGAANNLTGNSDFGTDLGILFGNAAGAFIDVLTGLLRVWTGWNILVAAILTAATEWLSGDKAKQTFDNFATGFANAISDNIEGFKTALSSLFESFGTLFDAAVNFISALFEAIFETWIKIGGWMAQGFWDWFKDRGGEGILRPVGEAVLNWYNPVGALTYSGSDGKWWTPG